MRRIALPPKQERLYYLPGMDWRIHRAAYLLWLVETLRYAACYEWNSLASARYWIANQVREARLEPNESPWPPTFDFTVAVNLGETVTGRYGTSRREPSRLNRCRQKWWARNRDHAKWIEFQIGWLEDIFKGLADRIQRMADKGFPDVWQIRLNEQLDVFEVESTKCGCFVEEQTIELHSGVELGLYE